MPLYNLTKEQYEKLKDKEQKNELELKNLKSITNKEMWLKDLEELKI